MTLAPGIVLSDRYELHELLGEGAFGRVHRGRDRRLDRPVAIKLIAPRLAADPAAVRDFVRETRLLARVSDPGIVQIHDAGDGPDGPFSVSELVRGEDLAHRVRRGAVDPATAREIAIGICSGLAAAHVLGIVHGDVKPSNVLIADGGAVKVADFGVARFQTSATDELSTWARPDPGVAGTPRYMAPEQNRGGPVTAAVDVYGTGVVLYELLAGRPPFTGDTAVAVALAHASDPVPELPASVPAALRAVVERALAKDPADRFPDAAAMARALRDAPVDGAVGLDAGPTGTRLAPRRSPRATFDPSGRRRRAGLLGLVAIVLGALVAGAVLLGDGGGRSAHRSSARRAAAAPPVEMPLLVGEDVDAARAALRARGLRVTVTDVPAPGIRPGTVTSESPVAGRTAPAGGAVHLAVSEVPRWRTVATVTGRTSAPVRIIGERLRLLVSATGARACTLWVFCHSSSVSVTRSGASAPLARVGVSGGSLTRVLDDGPGTYSVSVAPASGATRWTIRVQDDY